MPKRILGSGWKFPISHDKNDSVAISRHEQKIAESIMIILGTAKGERVMRPDFGCDIHDYVFSVIDISNLTLMKSAVREALTNWEPRIEVLNVNTATDRLNEGRIDIRVEYKVRYTNTQFNLVYPFFLRGM